MRTDFDSDEVNALIYIVRAWGIEYLIGSDPPAEDRKEDDPVRLIQRLASCGYPLVEDASISLFILHPELALSVVTALQESEPGMAESSASPLWLPSLCSNGGSCAWRLRQAVYPCSPKSRSFPCGRNEGYRRLLRVTGAMGFSHCKGISGKDMRCLSIFCAIGGSRSIICLPGDSHTTIASQMS